jgi:hypothetical protein
MQVLSTVIGSAHSSTPVVDCALTVRPSKAGACKDLDNDKDQDEDYSGKGRSR